MTYAILGATGQVGSSILQLLAADPETKINVLVRSRHRLETTFPRLSSNAYIYDDLARAEAFLRHHLDWLDMTFFMPGGLTHDVQLGHELSTQRQQTFVSFLDAAAGMVEIADLEERGRGRHVSVVLREGRKAGFEWWAPVVLGKGLLCYFVPGLFAWLP